MKKRALILTVIILFYSFFFISTKTNAQTFEIPKTSVYIDRKKIDHFDNELRFNNRFTKKGIIFSVKYQKHHFKAKVLYNEINSVDSVVINISSYARKNIVDITTCKKIGLLYIQTCLRCTGIIPYSEIILYESTTY